MLVKNLIIVLSFFAVTCFGQQNEIVFPETEGTQQLQEEIMPVSKWSQARTSLNVGLLMGGGGLVGVDAEFLIGKSVGLQLGCGLSSMGFSINYHLKPYINSQFVSFAYWQQGFFDNHYASYLGPMYVFRAKKLFQFGVGFGSVLSKGPGWERSWENKKNEPTGSVALIYNIGLFFPL